MRSGLVRRRFSVYSRLADELETIHPERL
jgi:hypothetical protein